jgi:type II secretory pathway pseudopilin PulG
MVALMCFVLAVLALPFKSKSRLEAENAALRHQLVVLRRKVRGRAQLSNNDRWFFVQLYRWFPSILEVVTILRPETLVRWHRDGFRRYWRWKFALTRRAPANRDRTARADPPDERGEFALGCAAHSRRTAQAWV